MSGNSRKKYFEKSYYVSKLIYSKKIWIPILKTVKYKLCIT